MDKLIYFLNGIRPLSTEISEHLKSIVVAQTFKKKEYLFKEGRVSDHIYFIEKGFVRCFYGDMGGKEVTTWFMGPTDLAISGRSFFTQQPSVENIQALDLTVTYKISYAQLQFMYENFLEFNVHGRKLGEHYQIFTDERLYILHLTKAEDRYQYLLKTHPDLISLVPAQFLASYIGTTRSHLSVIKGKGKK